MISLLRKLLGFKTFVKNDIHQNTKEVSKKTKQHTNNSQRTNLPFQAIDMKKFLIAGLGNIGPKYENTRHNIGFKMLDYLAKDENLTWETAKLGDITTFKKKGRTFILLKPSTYMNLSGKAVQYWLTKEKIPVENLLVVTDDLNLPFGAFRIKTQGSSGGHNGLKDIQATLGNGKYPRFRFGISDAFSKGRQIDYVLGTWTAEETSQLIERLEKGKQAIISFGLAGANNTMNAFNGK